MNDTTTEWDVYWSGYSNQRRAGVAIAIRKSVEMKIVDFGQVSPRLIWIDCIFHGIRLRIVSAYAPTEKAKDSAKDHFYKTLRDHCVVGPKQQLILGGDLNATADFGKSFMGGKKCDFSGANNNGTRLYEFLNLKEYLVIS